ncbi:MAG: YdeI/OmpD-associated family protein [Shimia sp.]
MSDEVEVRDLGELRAWLAGNHERPGGLWLIYWKAHTPHALRYGDIVSELLCWGWVDSTPRKVDADRTGLRIAPRNAASAWSAVNKAKVAEMRAAGRMTPAGEAAIATAQANGMWDFLDDVDRLEVPDDLAAALGALRPTWDAFPPSVRRGTLEWIKTAKRAHTRATRIEAVREDAAHDLRPRIFRR